MDTLKRFFVTVIATAGITAAATGTAAAAITTDYVGGGEWIHGTTDAVVLSEYFHKSKCHGVSAVGKTTERDSASAGKWARTSARKALWGNESYWRTSY